MAADPVTQSELRAIPGFDPRPSEDPSIWRYPSGDTTGRPELMGATLGTTQPSAIESLRSPEGTLNVKLVISISSVWLPQMSTDGCLPSSALFRMLAWTSDAFGCRHGRSGLCALSPTTRSPI
jgi:hypothetical protein